MIKKFIYLIIPLAGIFSVFFYSCSSDVYDEDDIIVVRDTVTIKVDTTIREQREMEKVKLLLVIQLAAFNSKDRADVFADDAKTKLTGEEVVVRKAGDIFAVTVGTFAGTQKAENYLYYVKSKGFDKAFIKNIKY